MEKNDYHRQCKLSRQRAGRMEVLTTWLPEMFARVGKVLELEMSSGKWENGWAVCEIYERRKSKEVAERERDYKKNRLASDI